jgi:hypothetical protein
MNILLLLLLFQTTEVPFKLSNEFEVKIDLSFKQKENDFNQYNKVTLDYTETVAQKNRRLSGNQLPYLVLKITFLTLSDQEKKVKIINNLNKNIYSKKAELTSVIRLDLGFVDDIKDRVSPNTFDIILSDADKTSRTHILIVVQEDGTFLVNNEKRGKF